MLRLNKLDVLYLLQQFVSIGSLIYFGLFSAPQMPQLPDELISVNIIHLHINHHFIWIGWHYTQEQTLSVLQRWPCSHKTELHYIVNDGKQQRQQKHSHLLSLLTCIFPSLHHGWLWLGLETFSGFSFVHLSLWLRTRAMHPPNSPSRLKLYFCFANISIQQRETQCLCAFHAPVHTHIHSSIYLCGYGSYLVSYQNPLGFKAKSNLSKTT